MAKRPSLSKRIKMVDKMEWRCCLHCFHFYVKKKDQTPGMCALVEDRPIPIRVLVRGCHLWEQDEIPF